MDISINYLAVILAAVASMVVGAAWYSTKLFGVPWMKLTGVDINKSMTAADNVRMYGLTIIASLIMAYVLAYVTFLSNNFFGASYLESALNSAFWLWLGFTAVRFLTHDLFEGRPAKLTLLNAGNELATVVVMALVIGIIGV